MPLFLDMKASAVGKVVGLLREIANQALALKMVPLASGGGPDGTGTCMKPAGRRRR